MHICYVNPPAEFYSPMTGGAIATVTMEQARLLTERGHHVTILTITDTTEPYAVGTVIPVRSTLRSSLSLWDRGISKLSARLNRWDIPYYEHYLRSFTAALNKLQPAPDVVIIHNDLIGPIYIRTALPNAKIVLWLHNEQTTHRSDETALARSVDIVVAVSDFIRDWTAKQYPRLANKIRTILNGVNLATFYPRDDYLEPVLPVRALFIGRIDPNKGPDIAADAVAAVRSEGGAITLDVVGGLWFYGHGNEMENPYFRVLHAKMQCAEACYIGHVNRPDVPGVVRNHDLVFLLARSNDPCPLVAFEAMASGCAVIASDRGGIPQACGNGALLVDPDDFESVLHSLRTLISTSDGLRAAKKKAVNRAAETTWAKNVDALESLLTATV